MDPHGEKEKSLGSVLAYFLSRANAQKVFLEYLSEHFPSFVYKKDAIQMVNGYTYLGIKITSTGNFTFAEETLKKNVQFFVPKLLRNVLTR